MGFRRIKRLLSFKPGAPDPPISSASQDHLPLMFGNGAYRCIGHYVARLDMKEAFKALWARLPNMKIGNGATYLSDSGNTADGNEHPLS